jgi:hypothetical protein
MNNKLNKEPQLNKHDVSGSVFTKEEIKESKEFIRGVFNKIKNKKI